MTTTKVQLTPNTTLYPVPVVLITCGVGKEANVFTLNRIASCNAEPPMVSISVRPMRASHDLIERNGDFVVNLPWPDLELVGDFVGSTTMREMDKWQETGLTQQPGAIVQSPILAECPVNLECRVHRQIQLPSHTLFVAEVVALHADPAVLNHRNEVDYSLVQGGLPYRTAIVRERPIDDFNPEDLRAQVHEWRDRNQQRR